MGLKNDKWIAEMAMYNKMISPFAERQVSQVYNTDNQLSKVISYGVSSYGYDMRVGTDFKVFSNMLPGLIDPKNFQAAPLIEVDATDNMYDVGNQYVIIPPNSFALAHSVEYFRIPRGVITICLGKSTYARCGIVVNVTAFEPEWEGNVTIEISNTTPLPAKIYANEGIAQVLFFEGDEMCSVSYKDRKGKYQSQVGITLPIV